MEERKANDNTELALTIYLSPEPGEAREGVNRYETLVTLYMLFDGGQMQFTADTPKNVPVRGCVLEFFNGKRITRYHVGKNGVFPIVEPKKE